MTPRALGIVLSPPEWAWLEEHRPKGHTITQFAHDILQRYMTVNDIIDNRTIRQQIEEGPL